MEASLQLKYPEGCVKYEAETATSHLESDIDMYVIRHNVRSYQEWYSALLVPIQVSQIRRC